MEIHVTNKLKKGSPTANNLSQQPLPNPPHVGRAYLTDGNGQKQLNASHITLYIAHFTFHIQGECPNESVR